MKKLLRISGVTLCLLSIFLTHSCQKDSPPPKLSTITTTAISAITQISAVSGGNITSDGGASVAARGVCWSTTDNPTTTNSKTVEGTGTGQFVSNIIGLTAGTTYHVRAYSTNSVGTAYGADMSFATLGGPPESLTQPATNITISGATLNGTVNAHDLSTSITFEYGTSTNYGSTVTASQSPLYGNTSTIVSASITGLIEGTIYHFRVKAVNSHGTSDGSDVTFPTSGQAPSCLTRPATNESATGATLNGTVNANDLSTTVTFEYGTTTSYGQTVTATQSPVTGSSNTNVSASITGLIEGTIYHFRVKAVNSLGTTYGSDMSFTPTASTTVLDVDGNIYNTVTIGTQVWMKENLKTTKYNDGTPIPNITVNTAWEALTTGAYCDYSNTPANSTTYGRLYNWFAVDNNALTKVASNGGKNVCPTNWHVPTDDEWTTLTTYLGGTSVAGGKLKEAGTTHWNSPNTGATNETGFTALPGGYRADNGTFNYIGIYGSWWSSTEYSSAFAWFRTMRFDNTNVLRNFYYKPIGFSVRCLRD